MCCGNVSSEDGRLYSYSARIAERKVLNGRRLFAIAGERYSKTTGKHISWIHCSLPLRSNSGISAKLSHLDEPTFQQIEKAFSEIWNDKQYSWAFRTGRIAQFDGYGYDAMCKEINETLTALSNPRVSRFSAWCVVITYLEILEARKFREIFCKTSKPKINPRAKAILTAYRERLKKKDEKKQKEREALQAKIAGVVERNMKGLSEIYLDWDKVCKHNRNAWRERSEVRREYVEQAEIISSRLKEIAELNGLDSYQIRQRFTEITGLEFASFNNPTAETMLRINGDDVETSRGARLPVTLAKGLWKRYGTLVRLVSHGQDVEASLPIQIGPFMWTHGKDRNLVIGCHTLPAREVELLADSNGW